MKIAIIADDTKKKLMCQFCTAYCGILSKHQICATGTTAKYISEAAGLSIEALLPGSVGGESQIAARMTYGEVDLLICFRDGRKEPKFSDRDFAEILRLCVVYNIPFAINIGTAEALIIALDRGDLDWRLYQNG